MTNGLIESYKSSGIEWIGEIPSDWNVERGKHVLTLLKREIKDDMGIITCYRDGQVTLRSNRREDGYTIAEKEGGYQGIYKGDLVIHGMDGFAGAIGISDSYGKGSPVLIICEAQSGYSLNYICYYLRLLANLDVFTAIATRIRERSGELRWNKIANLLFPLPNNKEQYLIADFLDKKCLQIDNYIRIQKNIIENLKKYKSALITKVITKGLHNSSEKWIVSKIKYNAVFNPNSSKNINNEDLVSFVPMECISNDYIDLHNVIKKKNAKLSYVDFSDDDIIMAKITPCFENGNIAIAKNLKNKMAFGSTELYVIRTNKNIYNRFLFYFLQNDIFKKLAISSMHGIGRLRRVSLDFIKNYKFAYPQDLFEQKEIVNYLDKKCTEINNVIFTKEHIIKKLLEYKKSIIYEYVTGKQKTTIHTVYTVHSNK